MPPKVSIIIVSWNGLPLLQKCLPSVQATRYDNFEIVVVDNGSTDESVAWLRQQRGIVVLPQSENLGFCGGNNVGIQSTSSDFVVLLNNDVEVEPNWLSKLIAAVGTAPDIAAAQPTLRSYKQRDHFEYAGAAGGHLDDLGYPFARGRLFDSVEVDHGQYGPADTAVVPVFWASGAALLLRRAAVDKVGLLDERLFMHMEEIDLCWRFWNAGFRVVSVPDAIVFHIGGASLSHANPRKTYYNFRNSLLLLYKHSESSRWPVLFIRRLSLDSLAVARAVLTLRFREAGAILKAYLDVHRQKSAFRDDRPGSRGPDSVRPSFRGSIVLQYFLLGRTSFSQLPPNRFRKPFAGPLPAEPRQPK